MYAQQKNEKEGTKKLVNTQEAKQEEPQKLAALVFNFFPTAF